MDLTKRERIRTNRMISWVQITFGLAAAVLIVVAAQMAWGEIPRTADGKPDLSGYYDTATITPLERRSDEEFFSEERAEFFAARAAKGIADGSANQDPNREAPPVGGDGSPGAAGNVGGYDSFWVDPGERNFQIDGKYRSSIVIDPPNGRRPPLTDEARQRQANQYRGMRRPNDGTAWWLENDGPGPYDGPEIRPFPDRCLMGFGSTGGPPMLPTLYNNHKRIVQTPDHVMILTEMVHDARIVRINDEHVTEDMRRWYGDSIGWWEGDTLVIDTVNFNDTPNMRVASRNLHVVERFSRIDENTVLYNFTVEDPSTWEAPWTGEYTWPQTEEPVYEYACHEGNYSMGNILRGARRLEREAMAAQTASTGEE